ncbi:MAG: hypothetical protein NWF09_07610 [Candidatus Bathyarchaeota archaeon]|nr:hypothetical protein [Candidatus Bathyarchaeota archaeon]
MGLLIAQCDICGRIISCEEENFFEHDELIYCANCFDEEELEPQSKEELRKLFDNILRKMLDKIEINELTIK